MPRPPSARLATAALVVLAGSWSARVAAAIECPHDPAAAYRSHCARCHGQDGRSDTTYARALKVEPLADNRRLAEMPLAEIVKAVRTNDKHALLVQLDNDDLQCAALFVRDLAKRRGTRARSSPGVR